MTNKHTSLEKIYSHTLFERVAKGLCVRGELETEQIATYWPPVLLSLSALLSRSARLLNRRSWGPIALCWVLVLSTASFLQLIELQLTEPVCGPGLYHCLTFTYFLWALHLHPIQPVHSQGYPQISSTGSTCSLIDCWVEDQYVTHFYIHLKKTGLTMTPVKSTSASFKILLWNGITEITEISTHSTENEKLFLFSSVTRIRINYSYLLKDYRSWKVFIVGSEHGYQSSNSPIDWGCRIHRLHVCWRIRSHSQQVSCI